MPLMNDMSQGQSPFTPGRSYGSFLEGMQGLSAYEGPIGENTRNHLGFQQFSDGNYIYSPIWQFQNTGNTNAYEGDEGFNYSMPIGIRRADPNNFYLHEPTGTMRPRIGSPGWVLDPTSGEVIDTSYYSGRSGGKDFKNFLGAAAMAFSLGSLASLAMGQGALGSVAGGAGGGGTAAGAGGAAASGSTAVPSAVTMPSVVETTTLPTVGASSGTGLTMGNTGLGLTAQPGVTSFAAPSGGLGITGSSAGAGQIGGGLGLSEFATGASSLLGPAASGGAGGASGAAGGASSAPSGNSFRESISNAINSFKEGGLSQVVDDAIGKFLEPGFARTAIKGAVKYGPSLMQLYSGFEGRRQSKRLQRQMQPPNPADVTKLPGYQAGLEAVQRSLAAQGYQGSGNMMAALAKYGGDFYNQAVEQNLRSAMAQAGPVSGRMSSNALIAGGLSGLGRALL